MSSSNHPFLSNLSSGNPVNLAAKEKQLEDLKKKHATLLQQHNKVVRDLWNAEQEKIALTSQLETAPPRGIDIIRKNLLLKNSEIEMIKKCLTETDSLNKIKNEMNEIKRLEAEVKAAKDSLIIEPKNISPSK